MLRFLPGTGNFHEREYAAPGAGSPLNIIVPDGLRWRIVAFKTSLTNNSGIANCNVQWQVVLNSVIVANYRSETDIPGSSTYVHWFVSGQRFDERYESNNVWVGFPDSFVLQPADIFQIADATGSPTNTINLAVLYVESWVL